MYINKKRLVTILTILILFTSFTGVNGESGLTEALKENIIPLKTTEAGNGFEDLMPLKEILKDKKIIAMGEATHGTSEFFKMKHRMFEFLVEEMGYRVFGIEAGFGSSNVVNDYILHGEGSVEKCLNSMGMWTWDTQEVADMIQWMREFNKTAEAHDKIRFYGFDMQGMEESLLYVLDYLEKVSSPSIEDYNKSLRIASDRAIRIRKGKNEELIKDIDKIHNELIENKNKYINNSSMEEYDLILNHMESIYQYIDSLKDNNPTEGFNNRDQHMAKNVNWIMDYETKYYGNDKIMIWAHNGHIANDDNHYIIMGKILKNIHKDDYYSIGFDFYQGGFAALHPFTKSLHNKGVVNFHISSSPKGSFPHEMMKTEIPISFLDIRGAKENERLSDFISEEIPLNGIGAVYGGKGYNEILFSKIIIKDTYDALIFIKSTTWALRSKPGTKLPDGNKMILLTYIFNVVIIIGGLIILVIVYLKKSTKEIAIGEKKYYLLEKGKEDLIDKKGFKGLIIRSNNYFNSIPTIKYWIFPILVITITNIISSWVNSLDLSQRSLYSNLLRNIMILLAFTLIVLIVMYLTFILPLKIIRKLSKSRLTNLQDIIIASIIGAIINIIIDYKAPGLLTNSIDTLIFFLQGLVFCYSYDLFCHRDDKPIANFIPILLISNILMMFFASIF